MSKISDAPMIYVGCDNGLKGAFAAVARPGAIIERIAMPVKAKTSGEEVDGRAVRDWIQSIQRLGPVTVILETPGKFAKGVQAISSMWDSYGCIRGMLETLDIRHHRIPPQRWQKVMIPNCAKGQTKPAAKSRAEQLWPEEKWLATARSRTPHDGLIDAALIAEYARQQNL